MPSLVNSNREHRNYPKGCPSSPLSNTFLPSIPNSLLSFPIPFLPFFPSYPQFSLQFSFPFSPTMPSAFILIFPKISFIFLSFSLLPSQWFILILIFLLFFPPSSFLLTLIFFPSSSFLPIPSLLLFLLPFLPIHSILPILLSSFLYPVFFPSFFLPPYSQSSSPPSSFLPIPSLLPLLIPYFFLSFYSYYSSHPSSFLPIPSLLPFLLPSFQFLFFFPSCYIRAILPTRTKSVV